jgi:hypothetical protein
MQIRKSDNPGRLRKNRYHGSMQVSVVVKGGSRKEVGTTRAA